MLAFDGTHMRPDARLTGRDRSLPGQMPSFLKNRLSPLPDKAEFQSKLEAPQAGDRNPAYNSNLKAAKEYKH